MQEMQLTAVVRPEDGWFVAQALEVDVASQGESPSVALDNLAEALELHYEPPRPTVLPEVHHLRARADVEVAVEIGQAAGPWGGNPVR